jgi:DNA polymerase
MVEQTHAFEPVESAGAEARSTPDVTRLRLGAEARVFLVGQSPGVEEIRTGRPFVGRAGKFLDEALCRVGLSRQVVFITSVEKHRPPGNRRPTRLEVEACKSSLVRQIAIVDPRVVVLLGRVAEEALAGEPVLEGRRVLVTAHPAAAMRFPWLRRRFLRDLHTLRRMARRAS